MSGADVWTLRTRFNRPGWGKPSVTTTEESQGAVEDLLLDCLLNTTGTVDCHRTPSGAITLQATAEDGGTIWLHAKRKVTV